MSFTPKEKNGKCH